MLFLGVVFGGIIGISLGLTGGGGAIFAVPMLVYGLDRPAREAVVVSLIAVGVVMAVNRKGVESVSDYYARRGVARP